MDAIKILQEEIQWGYKRPTDHLAQVIIEIERLQVIEAAAKNLIAQKGRHNTEIAYKRLEALFK